MKSKSSNRTPAPRGARLAERLAKRNAQFQAMSPVEKRKAIAADVLVRLQKGQLKPAPGKWVVIPDNKHLKERGLQKLLEKPDVTCFVCALGGAICGLAAMENEIDLYDDSVVYGRSSSCRPALYTSFIWHEGRLAGIFGDSQLALIEYTFENGGGSFSLGSLDERERVGAFVDKYPSPRARFRAIFKSILAHPEGLFVLP